MIFLHGVMDRSSLGFPAEYDLALPDSAMEGKKMPLSILLHDLGRGREQWIQETRLALLAEEYRTAFLLPEGRRSCFLDMHMGPGWENFLKDDLLSSVRQQFGMAEVPVSVIGIGSGCLGALQLAADTGFACALIDPDLCSPFAWSSELWPKEKEWAAVFENQQKAWDGERFRTLHGAIITEAENAGKTVASFGLSSLKLIQVSSDDLEQKLQYALQSVL